MIKIRVLRTYGESNEHIGDLIVDLEGYTDPEAEIARLEKNWHNYAALFGGSKKNLLTDRKVLSWLWHMYSRGGAPSCVTNHATVIPVESYDLILD
jgi:hypothetical protein